MIALLKCIIICITIIILVAHTYKWIEHMVDNNKPLFTWARCEWSQTDSKTASEQTTIGFKPEEEKKPTPKEEQEAILKDAAATISTLLRGEVDFDEFGK